MCGKIYKVCLLLYILYSNLHNCKHNLNLFYCLQLYSYPSHNNFCVVIFIYYGFFKRVLDIVLSFLGIVVLFIPMCIIAIITVIDSPGPLFFKQKRVGIHKQHFNIFKIRTMPVDTPSNTPTHLMTDIDSRLSSWQKFIRKYSIDEVPQLINILRGDMSIIGPRPALWNQFDLIEEREKYGANDIRPGLTGWAQINGRDELEIADKAKLDGEYANRVSFLFDIRCFFGTVLAVLRTDGVVEGGTGTIEATQEKEEANV